MCKKKSRFWVSLFALIMLASSQVMTAAHACQQLLPSENAPLTVAAPMPADCPGMDMDSAIGSDETPSPLCLAHCEHAAQLQPTALPDLPSIGLIVLFEVPKPDISSINMWSGIIFSQPFLSLTEGSPPLRIQYQVFRI